MFSHRSPSPGNAMRMLVLLLCLAPGPALRAQDCNFSQEHQFKVLQNAATQVPGGMVAQEKREVIWALPDGGSTTFGYGGCYHLGSIAFRSIRVSAPLTQEQVIEAATELANRFWTADITGDSLALDTLLGALRSEEFILEQAGEKTFINISHPAFVELYIEHSYGDGFDTVGISWQGKN